MSETSEPSVARQEYFRASIVIAVCLLISIWLQVQVSPSPMTASETVWQQKLDLHLEIYPFSTRPLQSYTTLALHNVSGLPVRESFFSIQFVLAIFLGLAFYRLMRQIAFAPGWSLTGLALLMTAYPIIGAHWEPTHTWDDFWAYLFLVLSISACLRRQPVWSSLLLIVAMLAREPIIACYPLTAFIILSERKALGKTSLILALALPLVFFLGLRLIVGQDMDFWRWPVTIMGNFLGPLRQNDTIVSLIIAFGFMWFLSAIGLVETLKDRFTVRRNWLAWGALIVVPATLGLALTGALVRETRILFPPFVCIVPLSVMALKSLVEWLRPRLTRRTVVLLATLFVLCVTGGIFAANTLLFPRFYYPTGERIRRPLAGFHLGAIVAIGALIVYKARSGTDREPQ